MRRGEGEKGRRGEGEKGRRGEGEKGRRGEGEKEGKGGEGQKETGEIHTRRILDPTSHTSSLMQAQLFLDALLLHVYVHVKYKKEEINIKNIEEKRLEKKRVVASCDWGDRSNT